MTKKEQLDAMRREHARERQEARDDEWYIRDGEDVRIEKIRENMARILTDSEISGEKRKTWLAELKEEIEQIMETRDEREHSFIEKELSLHEAEQKLALEVEAEERVNVPIPRGNSLTHLFRVRSSLTVGAEQLRKNIEEQRKELSEEEQFSTILINNSERGEIPSFKKSRRKKAEEPEQTARIDTVLSRQREIGQLYKESQEMQNLHLGKIPDKRFEEDEPDEFDFEE